MCDRNVIRLPSMRPGAAKRRSISHHQLDESLNSSCAVARIQLRTLNCRRSCETTLSGRSSVGEEERTKKEGPGTACRSEETRRGPEADSRKKRTGSVEGRSED